MNSASCVQGSAQVWGSHRPTFTDSRKTRKQERGANKGRQVQNLAKRLSVILGLMALNGVMREYHYQQSPLNDGDKETYPFFIVC